MQAPRIRTPARAIRAGALVVTACLLLLPLPTGWSGGWRSTLLDFGHVPLFACFVLAWAVPGRPVWRAALLAAALAGAAEVVQALVGRPADQRLDHLGGPGQHGRE